MDPDEVLAALDELAKAVEAVQQEAKGCESYSVGQADVLAGLAEGLKERYKALDFWIRNEGFLPRVWRSKPRKTQYWIQFTHEDDVEQPPAFGPFEDAPRIVDNALIVLAGANNSRFILARYCNDTPPSHNWAEFRGWRVDSYYDKDKTLYRGMIIESRPEPPLRKFRVKTREVHSVEYVVEARSAVDAKLKVSVGAAADADRDAELESQEVHDITDVPNDIPCECTGLSHAFGCPNDVTTD